MTDPPRIDEPPVPQPPAETLPLTLAHWGAYRVRREAGRPVELIPLEGDPDPSGIGSSMLGALDDELRVRQPMVREGYLRVGPASREGRGRGEPFVPVSWERASDLVAEAMRRTIRDHGNEAIFGGSYGWASAGRFHHAQSQLHRFLNLAGGYTFSVNTHSHAAAEVLLPHVLGSLEGMGSGHTSWSAIARETELLVAFGGVPLRNTQVSAGGVGRHDVREHLRACRDRGMAVVNVSPLRDDVDADFAPEWLPVRPNTDTALMMGLAHTLLAEGLHDEAFLDRCTVGFAQVRAYLAGEADGVAKSADWAAPLCGLDAEAIRALARRMARGRTMIAVSWALQRAHHGEQPLWMAVCLAAMLGQIGLPGGGFGIGYGGSSRIGSATRRYGWPAFPQGANPVRSFIPVARLADMLLNPGDEFDYDGGRYRYPDIRMIYWAGGNPFHHQQDVNKLVRAWRKPDAVVVHEPWWNALARHADIVLPCTTSLERNDLGIARDEGHLFAMRRAAEPVGEARSDHDILTGIAGRLGFGPAFGDGLDEMGWIRQLYGHARQRAASFDLDLPDFETFWADGQVRLPPAPEIVLMRDFRRDPEAHPLATPSGLIELASERIAGFGYADCPGHPVWLPPAEWLGDAHAYPLHLISCQPATRLHSQYDNGSFSRETKIQGREPVTLHPDDAAARGIAEGGLVRVSSPRGACLAGARLSDGVARGTVQFATGAWFDPEGGDDPAPLERHGSVNVLTLDIGTSRLAQGPVAHTALVEVQPFAGEAPPLGITRAPQVLASDAA